MNRPQDLGGMHGFGPVAREADEPLFHAPWERRAFALTLAMGATGAWNLDMSRHARESLPPATYLSSTYYEIWARALERLLVGRGLVGADEIAQGRSLAPSAALPRVLRAEAVAGGLARGAPTDRAVETPARFAIGDRVRTKVMNPARHTRLPRYARGKEGTVAMHHGAHVFPDTHAHGEGEAPQHLYTIVFDGPELWGPDADPTMRVSIDAWDSYLDPA